MLLNIHILIAVSCLLLLILRGALTLIGYQWRKILPLRILPHIVDSLLIITGVMLFVYLPFPFSLWLGLKIAGLILYIIGATKFFSKKSTKPNPVFLVIAIAGLLFALFLGYNHSYFL